MRGSWCCMVQYGPVKRTMAIVLYLMPKTSCRVEARRVEGGIRERARERCRESERERAREKDGEGEAEGEKSSRGRERGRDAPRATSQRGGDGGAAAVTGQRMWVWGSGCGCGCGHLNVHDDALEAQQTQQLQQLETLRPRGREGSR